MRLRIEAVVSLDPDPDILDPVSAFREDVLNALYDLVDLTESLSVVEEP